jgi:hypothetical protein
MEGEKGRRGKKDVREVSFPSDGVVHTWVYSDLERKYWASVASRSTVRYYLYQCVPVKRKLASIVTTFMFFYYSAIHTFGQFLFCQSSSRPKAHPASWPTLVMGSLSPGDVKKPGSEADN